MNKKEIGALEYISSGNKYCKYGRCNICPFSKQTAWICAAVNRPTRIELARQILTLIFLGQTPTQDDIRSMIEDRRRQNEPNKQ